MLSISVSTLSVATSQIGSPTSTVSPIALSQVDSVPSVTDTPRWGIITSATANSYTAASASAAVMISSAEGMHACSRVGS